MNRSIDFWLITVTAMLTVLGLVMVYSASAVVAGEWGDEMRFLTRQLFSVAGGLVLCGITAFTPTRVLNGRSGTPLHTHTAFWGALAAAWSPERRPAA